MTENQQTALMWFKRNVPTGAIVYSVLLLFFLLSLSVEWRKNEFLVNETNPDTNLTIEIAKQHYVKGDVVPVKVWGDNTINSHLSIDKSIFIVASFIVFIILSNKKKKDNQLIDEEVYRIWLEQKIKQNTKHKTVNVDKFTILQMQQIDSEAPVPFRRQLFAEIETEEGWNRLCYTVNPFEFIIYDSVKNEDEINGKLKCDVCGKYPDFKLMTPKYLEDIKQKYGLGMKR